MPVDVQRVQAIFLAAIQTTTPAERAALVERECNGHGELRERVQILLRAHDQPQGLPAAPAAAIAATIHQPAHQRSGQVIAGRYKLLEQLGEGGMGAVWVAEQTEPVRRRVALKLIKPGMDSKQVLSRFEAERQALALMDHPNISKVYDGGMTEEGRPFFAMEYVKGVPLTEYCDQAKLPIHERLKLFVSVCQAVQHAHQKGIIHRDLKPTNILVCLYDGQPVPKVIDFGLAKAISQPLTEHTVYTAHGLMVGTPMYMSPEQAEFNNLDVDTRTDIYSLGVILYELLTGQTPVEKQKFKDAAFAEILRLIKEEEPPKPSTKISTVASLATIAAQRGVEPAQLTRTMRGDLDWIVMKALEKERARRYETANGLARDVERYLKDEPVEACPPSLAYKFSKLARRNKRGLITGALLSLAGLLVLLTLAGSVGWVIRYLASQNAIVNGRILLALDDAKLAIGQGDIPKAAAAIERAEGLAATADVQPAIQDSVRQWNSDLQMVRRLEQIHLQKAAKVVDQSFDTAGAAEAYAAAFREHGLDMTSQDQAVLANKLRASTVSPYLVAAVDDWATLGDDAHRSTLFAVARQADADAWRNQLRDAIARGDRDDLTRLTADAKCLDQLPATIVLTARELEQLGGRFAVADLLRRANGRYPDDFWIAHELGRHLIIAAEPAEAAGYLRSALARFPESPSVHNLLGGVYIGTGQTAEAEREFREALRLQPDFAAAHENLAFVFQDQEKWAEAETELNRAIELRPSDAIARLNLAVLFHSLGKGAEAEAASREALRLAPDDWLINESFQSLVRSRGWAPRMETEYRSAIEKDPNGARLHRLLGDMLYQQRKLPAAEQAYREAVRLRPDDALALTGLAAVLIDLNQAGAAVAPCREAIRLSPDFAWSHYCLAAALRKERKLPEAETSLREAVRLEPYYYLLNSSLSYFLRELGKTEVRRVPTFRTRRGSAVSAYYRDGKWLTTARFGIVGDWFPFSSSAGATRPGPGTASRPTDENAARQTLRLNPSNASVHVEMAWALLANSKYEEAEALARQALRFDSRHAGAYVSLGYVSRARGQWPEAEKMLRQALALKPLDEAQVHEGLVFVLEYQGKHAEAASAAEEAVRLDPMNANNHHQLAWIQARRGDLELAEQNYREELKLRPERAWSHQDLGWVLHRLGKLDEATKQFEEALALDPTFGHRATVGERYAAVGLSSNATQQYALAVGDVPDDHHAAMRLAFLLLLTGDRVGYETVARQMLEQFGQTDQAVAARRTVHVCLISPQFIGAIDQHQRLMEIAAGHVEVDLVQRERGLTAYRAGDWQAALTACRESRLESSQSVPTNSDALDPQNLLIEALALHQLGQAEESRAAYYEAARKSAARYFAYAPDYLGAKWVDWVAYEIVRREAAELLSISGEGNGRLARQRGEAAVGANDWQTAAREFATACQAPGSDSICWMRAASASFMAGDQAAYRDQCRQMFERFSGSPNTYDFERATAVSTIVPGAVPAGDLPVAKITAGIDDPDTSNFFLFWSLVARSRASYRADDWKAAAADADRALTLNPNTTARTLALSVAALAHHKLGDVPTAKERFAEATREWATWAYRMPDGSADYPRLARGDYNWHEYLYADLLYAEAKALVEGAP